MTTEVSFIIETDDNNQHRFWIDASFARRSGGWVLTAATLRRHDSILEHDQQRPLIDSTRRDFTAWMLNWLKATPEHRVYWITSAGRPSEITRELRDIINDQAAEDTEARADEWRDREATIADQYAGPVYPAPVAV